jgi:3-methyladenine DNA glycosylase AlkC
MAEPLKNYFGPDVPRRIGDMVAGAYGEFDLHRFLDLALDGFEDLELTERARHISAALAETMPGDREKAIGLLMASLGPENAARELTGMDSFLYLPHVFFVAENGLECFEAAMEAQYELTKRFTAEFSIRAFIEHDTPRTLQRLRIWAEDPNVHVRRLVSEGTRPRLPWAPRLKAFQEDPGPVLELLELLKDDDEEFVRRSVANNLNDISKDHPALAAEVARRWWEGGDVNLKRLVRHALRTLVKRGDQDALQILGFGRDSPATLDRVSCEPKKASIGGKVRLEAVVFNPSQEETGALVDFRVHFVKAKGSKSPKVFKGGERHLGPRERATVRKTISLAQQSTRTHYPGLHRVEVMLNGQTFPGCTFDLS